MKVRLHRVPRATEPAATENQLFPARRTRTATVASQSPNAEVAPAPALFDDVATTHEQQINTLLDYLIEQLPAHPLPYRAELDTLLGQPLPANLQVKHLTDAQPWLDVAAPDSAERSTETVVDLDAQALVRNQVIVLEDATPSFETVAHEVIHLLQANDTSAMVAGPLPATDPAEEEALRLAEQLVARQAQADWRAFAPLSVEAARHPQSWAALRGDTPPPAVSEEQTATHDLEQALAGPDQQPASGSAAPASEQEAQPSAGDAQAGPDLLLEEELPEETLEAPPLPEAPEPGVTEEDVAARQEALAAAEAALASAEDPKAVVDSYAAAPPTLKAREAGTVDQRVKEKGASEEQSYQENLPDFHAEMRLQSEDVPANEVTVPEQEAVDIEPEQPGAAPDVDLPPNPDYDDYAANDDVLSQVRSWLNSWFGEDRAERIGNNLRNVSTTDPDVTADPGEAPQVPLEGETDPERIVNQRDQAADQSRQRRDEAQQAVLDGPGPEQVQPRTMDEAVALSELAQPDIQAAIETQGPESYLQYGLPEEVDVAFDQQNQQAMEASFADAQTQIQEATDTRDSDRADAVADAESEAARLNEEADADQRDEVMNARNTIQTDRQSTLDAQRDAVGALETDIETRRTTDQEAINNRIATDEGQIQRDYDEAESNAQAEVDAGERDAADEKRRSEREAEDQSWWDRAVNFVKEAFEALTAAINAIFDAVRAAVNAILDAVKAAATALIRAAADFVKGAITLFGEFAKAAVNTLLADTFPGLARTLNDGIDSAVTTVNSAVDAVADTLIAGVNALVEGLRGALNAILDAFQAALNTVLQIMQAVLTGDWAAVIRLAFEAVLRVAGINPDDIYAFIGRAMETFQIILDNPLGFVGNLFNAFIGGVRQFADNILGHLQAGIIGWLTGALGPAGITLPPEFNLWGVLDIVRQVLGFTWDNIRSRVARIVGERAVQLLEFLYGYVETLITGGWGALWDQIMSDLAGLRDMVFEQIKEFVLTRLIMAAVTRLATMFNPVGAIVNLVIMIYQFYTFMRDNIQRLVQLITSVVDAIGDIARGILGAAKDRVESTLAQFLPLAIDLVARLIGLGNVGTRVRNIMTRVQQRIWGAIDRLIERVMARFRGGGATTGESVAATEGAAEQLGERLPIPTPDGTHHLTIAVTGTDINFVVSSSPQTIDQLVTLWRGRLDTINDQATRTNAERDLNTLDTTENAGEQTIEALLRDDNISSGDQTTALAEERALIPILMRLFVFFGMEGVNADLANLFRTRLDQADRFAQDDVLAALNRHETDVAVNGAQAPDWQTKISGDEFYTKPLLAQYGLGRETRRVAEDWMGNLTPATNLTAADIDRFKSDRSNEFGPFHTSRIVMVHTNHRRFSGALQQVQRQIFDGSYDYTYNTGGDFYAKYRESIVDHLAGTPPPHDEYQPTELTNIDSAGNGFTYTYAKTRVQRQDGTVEEVDSPRFAVTLQDNRVVRIQATGLRFKEILADVRSGQRGRMQSPPDYDPGLFLNRSHLVADEFMGSAYRNSGNVIVTSAAYNQNDMRGAEIEIGSRITRNATRLVGNEASVDPANITFGLDISVTYAKSVFDADLRREMEDRFLRLYRQHQSILEDTTKVDQQWDSINNQLETKTRNVQPVKQVRYSVTAQYGDRDLPSFTATLRADIYLGFQVGVVNQILRAAGIRVR